MDHYNLTSKLGQSKDSLFQVYTILPFVHLRNSPHCQIIQVSKIRSPCIAPYRDIKETNFST